MVPTAVADGVEMSFASMEVMGGCWVVATSALPAGIAFCDALAAKHRLCIGAERDYFEESGAALLASGARPLDRDCDRSAAVADITQIYPS